MENRLSTVEESGSLYGNISPNNLQSGQESESAINLNIQR